MTKKAKKDYFEQAIMEEAEKMKAEETNTDNPEIKVGKKTGKNDKVLILGTAETLKQTPYEDTSYDIWACATCLQHPKDFKRGDLLFEMHTPDRWQHRTEQINNSKIPVMMQKKYKEIPLSREFPVQQIWDYEPIWEKMRYVSNSVSWMTMYAMTLGYKSIGYFGVHFATNDEWIYERPNLEYYMGYAKGKGIDIWVPDGGELLKFPRLYGYENPPDWMMVLKQRHTNYEEERQKHAEQLGRHRDAMNQYIGAKEATKFWINFFGK